MMNQIEEQLTLSTSDPSFAQHPGSEKSTQLPPPFRPELRKEFTGTALQAIITNAPIVLFTTNAEGIITYAAGRGLEAMGIEAEKMIGVSFFQFHRDIPEAIRRLNRVMHGEEFTTISYVGDVIFETHYAPQFDEGEQICGLIAIATDITARVKAEEALSASEYKFRTLTEQSNDLVFIVDQSGTYQYASPSHERIMGFTQDYLLGRNIFEFIHPDDGEQVMQAWSAAFQGQEMLVRTQCRARHADGSWVTLEALGRNCFDDPEIRGFIINARDVSERIIIEQELRFLALHDALTDLPNRTLLLDGLEQAMQATGAGMTHQHEIALLALNLNRFKDINNTFGHHLGDTILQEVAERLSKALPQSGMIARLGGDEFALMQPLADKGELTKLIEVIHIALEEPFAIEGHPVQIDVSIGAALYPQHGGDPISLLRKADIAMYTAKHQHKEFALYEAAFEQDSARRLDLIRELRHAVGANEFRLYYQPKVEMKTGRVYGVEALIRWQHPTLGFIPPDQFIPLAEQTGQIMSLSRWVLEEALRQCRDWLQIGIDLEIAVNLSMWDLRDSSLPTTIRALLEQYQVPSRNLRVELTESAAMTDPEHTLEVLKQLANEGICSSIDDFGTGYSSLAYLKRLIVNELKIDRSFVRHITEEASDETIVRSTVTMAHSLGLKVVVEGVEDEASYNLLARLDCDTAQGYFMARPLPPHELECWLEQWQHPYVEGDHENRGQDCISFP